MDNTTLVVDGDGYSCLDNQCNYWALILVAFPLLTVFGNVLVILSVYREKTLQSITNYFIVSLAIADLLVAVLVMPFAVHVLVNRTWALSAFVCDFYIAMDVTCSTSSIFNLVAISIDRYIAVTKPIKYAKHNNNKRAYLTIIFVWIISAAIGSPIVLGLNNTPDRIPDACLFYNSDFIIYSSLSSFYIPCIIMIFLYFNIFKTLNNRMKSGRFKRKSIHMTNNNNNDDNVSNQKMVETSLMPRGSNLDEAVTNTGSNSVDDDDEDDIKYVHNDHENSTDMIIIASQQNPKRISSNRNSLGVLTNDHLAPKNDRRKSSIPVRFVICKAHRGSRKKRDKTSIKKEKKATITLAIVLEAPWGSWEPKICFSLIYLTILGVFLFCWIPFFTCNIMDAICSKLGTDCQPGVTAFLITTWLGYMNSFVNPIIYTIFNLEFRKAFKKIMHLT